MAAIPEIQKGGAANPNRQPVTEQRTTDDVAFGKYRVYRDRQLLMDKVKDPSIDVIILAAGTGTGKTRFGPRYALEALGPDAKMIVTENLRDASQKSAEIVAKDMDTPIGKEIGYRNKYAHNMATNDTRLLFCPVQSLQVRLEKDPDLDNPKYGGLVQMVAMDEVHKESKANEMALIQLRQLQERRKAQGKPPLKIMLISATLDEKKITDSFQITGAKVETVKIPGENIDVPPTFDTTYRKPFEELANYAGERTAKSFQVDKGNIIVFVSGKGEIDEATAAFNEQAAKLKLDLQNTDVIPYYGALPQEERDKLFKENDGRRKVVFCTNAAQESLTLDAHIVIDTTVHKHMVLDPETGRQYLVEEDAPMSHLKQRKGRVGRKHMSPEEEAQGYKYKYYALCTEEEWNKRPDQEPAEMKRSDLTQDALYLIADGHDPYSFKYINRPPEAHITSAMRRLELLGAVKERKLTEKGEFMVDLQLKPQLGSLIYESMKYGSSRKAAEFAAIMEEYPNVFGDATIKDREGKSTNTLASFKHESSDILSIINVFEAFQKQDSHKQYAWAKEHRLNYQKLKDANDLYNEIIEKVKEIKPDSLRLDSNSSLDKALYAGLGDAVVEMGKGGSYTLRGTTISPAIGKYSALYGSKPNYFVALDFSFQSDKASGLIKKRFATLNHAIPDEIVKAVDAESASAKEIKENKPPEKKAEEKAEEKSSSAPPNRRATEDKQELEKKTPPPPAPVKKPGIWNRFTGWLKWIFTGKR